MALFLLTSDSSASAAAAVWTYCFASRAEKKAHVGWLSYHKDAEWIRNVEYLVRVGGNAIEKLDTGEPRSQLITEGQAESETGVYMQPNPRIRLPGDFGYAAQVVNGHSLAVARVRHYGHDPAMMLGELFPEIGWVHPEIKIGGYLD